LTHSALATFLVRAIGPDQLETWKAAPERSKQQSAAVVVLDVGLVHQHVQHQPVRVDEEMALAAFDLLPAIVAARPPFWLVFTGLSCR
jgi:hypothetical protein